MSDKDKISTDILQKNFEENGEMEAKTIKALTWLMKCATVNYDLLVMDRSLKKINNKELSIFAIVKLAKQIH